MTTNEWKRRCERQREEKKVTRVRNVPEDEQHAVVRSYSLVDSLPSLAHAIRHNRSSRWLSRFDALLYVGMLLLSLVVVLSRDIMMMIDIGSSIIKRYIMMMIDIDSSIIKRYLMMMIDIGSSIIKRYIMMMIDIGSSSIKRYHDD